MANGSDPGHLSFSADAVNDVMSIEPKVVKFLDDLWGVLQVAVQEYYGVFGGNFHAASEGHLRAKISGVSYSDDLMVTTGYLANNLFTVVWTPIVDENDLVVDTQTCEDISEPPVHLGDGLAVAVTGDDR